MMEFLPHIRLKLFPHLKCEKPRADQAQKRPRRANRGDQIWFPFRVRKFPAPSKSQTFGILDSKKPPPVLPTPGTAMRAVDLTGLTALSSYQKWEENAMAKKNAKGGGTIRKKTVTRSGKEYTYWEARITTGRDPGTGKQIQRSFTGKTQKEVREKMQAAAVEVNQGTYTAPQRMTVGQWLDVWASDYLGAVKPSTADGYIRSVRNYIKPTLGAVRLDQLRPHDVQAFVNGLEGLAPSTARYHHQVLHTALEKAVELDYIPRNPAARCELPRAEQAEVHPLNDEHAAALLSTAI